MIREEIFEEGWKNGLVSRCFALVNKWSHLVFYLLSCSLSMRHVVVVLVIAIF